MELGVFLLSLCCDSKIFIINRAQAVVEHLERRMPLPEYSPPMLGPGTQMSRLSVHD